MSEQAIGHILQHLLIMQFRQLRIERTLETVTAGLPLDKPDKTNRPGTSTKCKP